MTHKIFALSVLVALSCRPAPSVDAATTGSASGLDSSAEPVPLPASSGSGCYVARVDSAGHRWLYRTACPSGPLPPPSEPPVPVTGLCCTPPDGPCLAVEFASECGPENDYLDCTIGYETEDGAVCLDAGGAQ